MALDRQRILGELGSVMKQLQNADCGCLGKLFGNSQQAAPSMTGNPLPTCGGCRRGCCHGHGYGQYNSPNPMNQHAPNTNYMSMQNVNPSQQPMSGNMHGFGPQIVNMMGNNHTKNMTGQAQHQLQGEMQGEMQGQMLGHMQGNMQGQLTGPMVIDAPQSPHGKVGLTPFKPPSMMQQGQFNPTNVNQGDVASHMQNQFIPQPNTDTNTGNFANDSPWQQQNAVSSPVANHMQSPQNNMTAWPQQSIASNRTVNQTPTRHSSPHGQHTAGIAKFNQMFPGVQQNLGGNLGFDPMAIAIQMNPDNHLQCAMDSMNKIMNNNKGIEEMFNKPPESRQVAGNTMNQTSPVFNGTTQQSAVSEQQGNAGQLANQLPISHNEKPNQLTSNQQNTINAYGQQIPQQNQQIYPATVNPSAVNQQVRYENNQQLVDQQQYQQQQIMDLNSGAPNLPVTYEVPSEENKLEAPPPEPTGYPNQLSVQRMIQEPIFPADNSRNVMNIPSKHQKNKNYDYNTLGQPIEMLSAKMYHPPEPSLPQTLSPQPAPVKPKSNPLATVNARAVKATVSKTSLMENKPAGKTPSRSQLQHIYNQYKGSQSFTQQNVRHPGGGTYSDGRLNVPHPTNTPPVPVERIGGDTIVNNPPNSEGRTVKAEQMMGQIGDVAAAKPAGGDSLPVKNSPVPLRKCRNGLQDMVFSSYPTSAAWTFHGHGRTDHSPVRRFQNRRY